MEYRILNPRVSDTGEWQLEYRDGWVWTVECFDTEQEALVRETQIKEEEDERQG
jgi:hypothetical protein